MELKVKRIYDVPEASDGRRILVDRVWPRGLTKKKAHISLWARTVAPSDALRKWYNHDPAKWPEFKERYFDELDGASDDIAEFKEHLVGVVTLLFGSKEPRLNNAYALKEYIEERILS